MNVADHFRHPHLRVEMQTIEAALTQGKPVLGICLGAQLLAHVLGAPVSRHVRQEIGWYDLHTTDAGRDDPVLGHLGDSTPVFQWHGCTFALPSGAQQLARTDTCEQQAFRYGTNAYGFQFHLEATAAMIERWLRMPAYRDELTAAGIDQDEHSIRAATAALIARNELLANATFDNFLDLVGRPPRRVALTSRHALPHE